MTIAEIIKSRMEELHVDPDQVAAACDVNRATVYRWLSGEIDNMKRTNIASLARFLHLDPALIVGNIDTPPEPVLTEHGKQLLAAYDSASNDTKKAIDRILKISDTSQLSLKDLQQNEIAQRAWVSEFGGGDDSALRRGKK
ncbi:MAG: helix-turn-helix domain-containing protein [Solobacterium sp.]|nr:helix-turn-helix domain-containing protein [Solobacterium sp.]